MEESLGTLFSVPNYRGTVLWYGTGKSRTTLIYFYLKKKRAFQQRNNNKVLSCNSPILNNKYCISSSCMWGIKTVMFFTGAKGDERSWSS